MCKYSMISFLTITYQRKHLLEEAIYSFLNQKNLNESDEMVIINDNKNVEYILNHPNIKIVNLKERFASIESKYHYGYTECKNDYIYRLEDDDLLARNALNLSKETIKENPVYEIYRSSTHYYFVDNKFKGISGNYNTGVIYTQKYLKKLVCNDMTYLEDMRTFGNYKAKVFTSFKNSTMIYRWGMNTYHISGMGNRTNKEIYDWAEKLCIKENGIINLNPHFDHDYYKMIE